MSGDISAGGTQNLVGHSLGGRYDIVSRLGKGGMAVVYRANDRMLARTVAIKVLRTDVAKDPVAAKRLVREARAAGQLHHPNIITMHDVGDSDGMVYIVMEVLQGRELSELMDESGSLGLVRSIEIARQTASALAVAHAHRIIHRDIKPENLFICRSENGEDHVKVLDFSIAKLPTNMVTAALTRAGSVFGTPHYMAPEQVEGREVSPQTDLYALGAVLFESILGEPPFDGDSVIDILLQHVRATAKRLDFDGRPLPPGLADLVESMLAKKESDRPTSAEEVERQLARCLVAARVIEGSGATIEMPTIEQAALGADFGYGDSEATFKLKGDVVASTRAAADAAAQAAPTEASSPPAAPAAPTPAAAPARPAVAPAPASPALDAAVADSLPTNLDLPDELPGSMRGEANAASADIDWSKPAGADDPADFSGRTMMGHGLAAQVLAEAARIQAERAARAPALGLLPAAAAAPAPASPPSAAGASKPAPPPLGRAHLPTSLAAATGPSAPTATSAPTAARPAVPGAPQPSAPPSSAPPSSAPPTSAASMPHAPSARQQAAKASAGPPPSAEVSRAAAAETVAVSAEDQAALAEALGARKQLAPAPQTGPSVAVIAIGAVVVVGVLTGALFVLLR